MGAAGLPGWVDSVLALLAGAAVAVLVGAVLMWLKARRQKAYQQRLEGQQPTPADAQAGRSGPEADARNLKGRGPQPGT